MAENAVAVPANGSQTGIVAPVEGGAVIVEIRDGSVEISATRPVFVISPAGASRYPTNKRKPERTSTSAPELSHSQVGWVSGASVANGSSSGLVPAPSSEPQVWGPAELINPVMRRSTTASTVDDG